MSASKPSVLNTCGCKIFHFQQRRLNVKQPSRETVSSLLSLEKPGVTKQKTHLQENQKVNKISGKGAVVHLHNHLGQACSRTTNKTRAKWVIITITMIVISHPCREKIKFEQIICCLIFSPHSAHVGNWVGCSRAANNDELSIPAIILTIITALLYFIQQ